MDGNLTINVRSSADLRFSLSIAQPGALETTIVAIKSMIKDNNGVETTAQRLIFKGRVLKDDQTIGSYGFEDNQTIHLVASVQRSVPSVGTEAAPRTSPTQAPAPAPASATSSSAANPFSSMMGGGVGMPGMPGGQSMEEMHRQMLQNPEQMQQMMSSPMVQQMMSNPEVMESIINSNPQMRAMMEANPQLRHALRDPQTLREMGQMASNPNAMAQAMRSQELQMSQIENMPGGFAAMASMLGQMPDAGDGTNSQTASNTNNDNTSGENNPTSTAVPNPWGSSAPTSQPSSSSSGSNNAANANPFASMMGGMGGMNGMPNMGGAGMEQMAEQMMNNPQMMAMMEQQMNNPAMMAQVAAQMRSMPQFANNPMMQQMLNNPDTMRQMMNPNMMRMAMNMRRGAAGAGAGGANPGAVPTFNNFAAPAPAPAPAVSPVINGLDFSDLLNNFRGGSAQTPTFAQPPPAAQQAAPEVRFASQLESLSGMGFTDVAANISALQATNGNVNRAVERLLGA